MGVILGSWPFGIALGLVSQSTLAATYSWSFVMYSTAGVCTVALAVVLTLYRSPPSLVLAPSEGIPTSFRVPMREFLPVSMAGLAWGTFNVGLVLFFSFTPDLLTTRGLSTADASSVVSVGLWVSILSVPLGGYLTERVGFTNGMIVIFSIATAGALFLIPYLPIPLALSILVGLGIGPPAGAIVALPAQALSAANRGLGLGIFFSWYYAAMAAGPAIAGVGRDLTSSAAVPVLIGGAMFVATALFVSLVRLSRVRVATKAESPG